jgi:hypothetical protein
MIHGRVASLLALVALLLLASLLVVPSLLVDAASPLSVSAGVLTTALR